MLEILEEYQFPIHSLSLFSSPRSAGEKIFWKNTEYTVELLDETSFDRPLDFAFFSAGGDISKKFAPIAEAHGVVVIDNSSAWRMDSRISLIVPEINFTDLNLDQAKIIANPNCSTIQSVLPLKALAEKFTLKRVAYTTYQAVSGSGQKGIEDLKNGELGLEPTNYFHPIYNNCFPHIDSFLENGYTKEEDKMINETRKILSLPDLPITATCVRIPVLNSHSVAINVTLEQEPTVEEIQEILGNFDGICLEDNPSANQYPMPLKASGNDLVWVGRIRKDQSLPNTYHIWSVADNTRKGAASNAVQIACRIIQNQ